uniref:Uncharacterized protein n=1 Tax=Panagrolaimus sp. JU765 TaxID=591449 RepID=A0AC34QKE6_9BILA
MSSPDDQKKVEEEMEKLKLEPSPEESKEAPKQHENGFWPGVDFVAELEKMKDGEYKKIEWLDDVFRYDD